MHSSCLKTRKKKKGGKERRKSWGSEVVKKKEDRKEGGREEIREEWRKGKETKTKQEGICETSYILQLAVTSIILG